MQRYWISDEVDTPQRFPLQSLLDRIVKHAGNSSRWLVARAEGYGEQVNELSREIDEGIVPLLETSALRRLLEGVEEWFYHLDVRTEDGEIRFGLHDSSATYLEASAQLAEAILRDPNSTIAEVRE
jgi:hypothetical protein